MIVVTGSPRSGTSMWMQILKAAGLPLLGDAFPEAFDRIEDANRAGFYESRLRHGIYHATNPHPDTGVYLHPASTRRHVIKVFTAGLVRTDHAFLDRVIATVRPWRQFCSSMERLDALNLNSLRDTELPGPRKRRIEEAIARREDSAAPAISWWTQLYGLIRDASIRRYPVHIVTYDRVLRDRRAEIHSVLEWLATGGDLENACRAVRSELRTQDTSAHPAAEKHLDAATVRTFDRLYEALDDGTLDAQLIEEMNALDARIRAQRA